MSRKIVEKNDVKKEEELFVFGYSCKLFKDEKKASLIDQGKHLIPWMGCESLLIDRFDVRGYLQDLRLYEAPSGLYSKDICDDLSDNEIEIERLCDEERYSDLKFEDEDLHEEEMKRLRAALAVDGAYHEIQFNYETCETQQEEEINNGDSYDNSENDPFVTPSGLILPEGILVPQTMKQHNLIEKTAKFISNHGVQMEILIKTKQSSNPQFDFLAFDSPLNPYYKLLVSLIKSGKYNPKSVEKDSSNDEDSEDEESDNYLHPSLLGTKAKSPTKPLVLPTLPRGVNETDSYSLLVKSLKDKIPVEIETVTVNENHTKHINETTEIVQNVIASTSQLQSQQNWPSLLPPPPPEIEIIIEKLAQYVSKNGEEFESTVRKRGEERFEFLNPGSMYHAHYIRKKLQYLEDKRKTQAAELKLKSALDIDGEKQSKAPVSFSFKEKKSTVQTEEKGWKSASDTSPPPVFKKTQFLENDSKKAADMALADKLAAAARDRLSREKQLQEERKRKAALFLSMVKNKELRQDVNKGDTSGIESSDQTTYGPSLPSGIKSDCSQLQASPLREDTKPKGNELTKTSVVLPFVISDEPLKESSRSTYLRDVRSSHRHHHHRHRHSHRRKYERSRSRSKSRHSRSSRSRSRSKSPFRNRKSRTRSRSRSRSSKK